MVVLFVVVVYLFKIGTAFILKYKRNKYKRNVKKKRKIKERNILSNGKSALHVNSIR